MTIKVMETDDVMSLIITLTNFTEQPLCMSIGLVFGTTPHYNWRTRTLCHKWFFLASNY